MRVSVYDDDVGDDKNDNEKLKSNENILNENLDYCLCYLNKNVFRILFFACLDILTSFSFAGFQ